MLPPPSSALTHFSWGGLGVILFHPPSPPRKAKRARPFSLSRKKRHNNTDVVTAFINSLKPSTLRFLNKGISDSSRQTGHLRIHILLLLLLLLLEHLTHNACGFVVRNDVPQTVGSKNYGSFASITPVVRSSLRVRREASMPKCNRVAVASTDCKPGHIKIREPQARPAACSVIVRNAKDSPAIFDYPPSLSRQITAMIFSQCRPKKGPADCFWFRKRRGDAA
jgi:hypothetical protein